MIWSKFIMNFIACFIGLMIIVFLGTAFDTEMTFTWYAYTICGVLSAFYAWTKSANMNALTAEKPSVPEHEHTAHHHPHHHTTSHNHPLS